MPRALHSSAVDNEAIIRNEQLLVTRRQTVRALLNQQIEPVKINRLDEMMMESCLATLANVILHTEACESNPDNRACRLQFLHQIDAAAIGQRQIADEHIKLYLRA